jgi:acyl-CoA synthetase (AMP-forming)/AMP-acid ligase II
VTQQDGDRWRALGFEVVAARSPQTIAVVDNAGSYTYAELLGSVANAEQALRVGGVEADGTVLLLTPNRREAVAVYLAALRVGARIVLIDRRAGVADVRHAAEATTPQLLVAPDDLAAAGPVGLPILALSDAVDSERSHDIPAADTGRGTVVMFTSGTSSRPKAVLHTMRSLLAGVRNMAHTLSFSSRDAPFLISPLASITGVAQLHLALECGARLLLEDAFSTTASLTRLIDLEATVFGGAPFVLESLLAEADRQHRRTLPLRAVAVGGTSIPRALLEKAWHDYGIVPSRVYGSSECPIAYASAPEDDLESRLRDEGVAMPGTQARIDPATAELQIRGDNVFNGYLDAQDNADTFTSDGWFRTGDQAVLTAGRLLISGRLKEVVARKGLKISLAEVDEMLRGMPGILSAASYGLPDAETGERLAVAIQPDGTCDLGLEDVTHWLLSAGLAKRKLPEQIVFWEEPLPNTATGKVLRRVLADAGSGRPTYFAKRLQGR